MTEVSSSNELSRDYQEHLLARLLQPTFLEKVSRILKGEYFDEDLSPIVDFVISTWEKSRKIPTPAQMRRKLNGARLPLLKNSPMDFDVDQVRSFCECRAMRTALLSSLQELQEGNFEEARNSMGTALKGTFDTKVEVTDLFDEEIAPERLGGAFTGIVELDQVFNGGVCIGEAASVMAVTGGGKTSWLVHIGTEALLAKKNIFHVSLEMGKGSMRKKYFERMGLMKASAKKRKEAREKMGKAELFCAPPSSIQMVDIQHRVERLEFKPDLVIIDSIENLKCSRTFGERWAEEAQTVEEFKALVGEIGCAGWTSFQANRPGYGGGLIKEEHVKGSLDKCRLVDQIISLNQDDTEVQVDEDTGYSLVRMLVAKNRFGPKGRILRLQVKLAECLFEPVVQGY